MTTYYWIGGSGFLTSAMSGGPHLSLSSGGPPVGGMVNWSAGHSLIVDTNSGPAAMKISVTSTTVYIGGLDCSNAPIMSFADAGTLWFYGDVIFNSGMTFLVGCAFAGADQSLTTGGANIRGNVAIGLTGTFSLLDDFNGSAANRGFAHKSGIFNSGGHNILCGTFGPYGTPNPAREVHLGASALTLTGTLLNVWNVEGVAALDAGLATIKLTGKPSPNGIDFKAGDFTYGAVQFQNDAGNVRIAGSNTFDALQLGGKATYQFVADQTINTFTADAGVNRLGVQSSVVGAPRIITAQSVLLNNVHFRDIDAEGAIPWSGSSLADGGGNSNIQF